MLLRCFLQDGTVTQRFKTGTSVQTGQIITLVDFINSAGLIPLVNHYLCKSDASEMFNGTPMMNNLVQFKEWLSYPNVTWLMKWLI